MLFRSAIARDPDRADEALDLLADTVLQTGNYDSAICALRAAPALTERAAEHGRMRPILETAARRTRDSSLAAAARIAAPVREQDARSPLSRRELDVLALAAQGLTNASIASGLFISEKTVKTHLQNIYKKLGARSRTEAVVRAKDMGVLGA